MNAPRDSLTSASHCAHSSWVRPFLFCKRRVALLIQNSCLHSQVDKERRDESEISGTSPFSARFQVSARFLEARNGLVTRILMKRRRGDLRLYGKLRKSVCYVSSMGISLHDAGGHHHHGHDHGHGHGHGHGHSDPHTHAPVHLENGLGSIQGSQSSLMSSSDHPPRNSVHGHAHKHEENINVRAAFIHVLGDLCQSIGVLIAAYVIYYKVSHGSFWL